MNRCSDWLQISYLGAPNRSPLLISFWSLCAYQNFSVDPRFFFFFVKKTFLSFEYQTLQDCSSWFPDQFYVCIFSSWGLCTRQIFWLNPPSLPPPPSPGFFLISYILITILQTLFFHLCVFKIAHVHKVDIWRFVYFLLVCSRGNIWAPGWLNSCERWAFTGPSSYRNGSDICVCLYDSRISYLQMPKSCSNSAGYKLRGCHTLADDTRLLVCK